MMEHVFGPNWEAIQAVKDQHIPLIDERRVGAILLMSRLDERTERAQSHAFRAAKLAGREEQMVRASEHLRSAVWDTVWDSSWAEAWKLSWVISRAALALATYDLIGTGGYTVGDYMALAGPWLSAGFPDVPIWEGMDVA